MFSNAVPFYIATGDLIADCFHGESLPVGSRKMIALMTR